MIDQRVLYIVEGEDVNGLGPVLALGVQVTDKWVGFYDTVRGRQFFGKLTNETDDGFVWHRIEQGEDMGTLTFRALTLNEYNQRVRQEITGTVPDFIDTGDLHEWYRRKFGKILGLI